MDMSTSSMSISTESVASTRGDSRKTSNLSDLEEVIRDRGNSAIKSSNDPSEINHAGYSNADSVNHNVISDVIVSATNSSDDIGLLSDDSLGSCYDNMGQDEAGRYEGLLDNSAYADKYFKFTYTNSEIFNLGKFNLLLVYFITSKKWAKRKGNNITNFRTTQKK